MGDFEFINLLCEHVMSRLLIRYPSKKSGSWGTLRHKILIINYLKQKKMVEFKVFQRTDATLESEGTVLDLVGKDGKISIIPRNFKDKSKRVVLVLQKKNGKSATVSCSAAVSEGLRNKTIKLDHVLNFNVITTDEGVSFISMPAGALVTVEVKNLTAVDFVPSVVAYEELIG